MRLTLLPQRIAPHNSCFGDADRIHPGLLVFRQGRLLSSLRVDIMAGSWFRALELCSIGCTFIGPMEGDLLLAIGDNSLLPSSFDGSFEEPW